MPHPLRSQAFRHLLCVFQVCAAIAWLFGSVACDRPTARPEAIVAAETVRLPEKLEVAVREGRVTLRCSQTPLREVLAALAEEADFDLRIALGGDRLVQHEFRAESMERVLSLLLAGLSYRAEYVAVRAGAHRLLRLEVGAIDAPDPDPVIATHAPAADRVPPPRILSAPRRGPAHAPGRDPRSPFDSDLYDPDSVRADLFHPSPERRAAAVDDMDPEEGGVDLVLEVLGEDRDPDVRIAALDWLESEMTFRAVAGIIVALEDRDPRVAVRAIEAIEFVGDETLLGEIEPLLHHRDAAVRAAAAVAIESLE